jgi:hypothetical protein
METIAKQNKRINKMGTKLKIKSLYKILCVIPILSVLLILYDYNEYIISAAIVYFIFPAILIFREYILKMCIDKFILNKELDKKIEEGINRIRRWNNKAHEYNNIEMDGSVNPPKYTKDGEPIELEEFEKINKWEDKDKMLKDLREDKYYICRRKNLLAHLTKYYKQDKTDIIGDKVKDEIKRQDKRYGHNYKKIDLIS